MDKLIHVLTNDSDIFVQSMASQALGALHSDGVSIPLYAERGDTSEETRVRVALARLQELGAEVSIEENRYRLMIPHDLESPLYLEIGYLMAQLNIVSFPDAYAPLADIQPSLVVPNLVNPSVDFRESYPHGMKFFIRRKTYLRCL